MSGCLLLVLRACSVGPAYKRPDIALPEKWHDSTGPDAATVWPASDWWHGFGSGQLEQFITEAQRSNDDLAGAIARVQEADAQARIADALLHRRWIWGRPRHANGPRCPEPVRRVFNVFNPELTASYELDFWGKNRALRSAARAAAAASRYDQQTIALTVVSSVATSYFQTLELRDRIEVARQNLANGQKVLQGLKLEQTAGIATGLDVAQQRTTVALLDAAIPPLLRWCGKPSTHWRCCLAERLNRWTSRPGR